MSCVNIQGPCQVALVNGAGATVVLHTVSDVSINWKLATETVECDALGVIDERLKYSSAEISFTPVSEWAAVSALLSGVLNSQIGSKSHSNRWLEIRPLINAADQKILRFRNAALTGLGGMTCATGKQMWQGLTFTALADNSLPFSDATRLYTLLPYAAPAAWDGGANIITPSWQGTYGALTGMCTEAGWTVNFSAKWRELMCDCEGITNYVLEDTGVEVSGIPLITHEQSMGLVAMSGLYKTGVNVAPGQSLFRPTLAGAAVPFILMAQTDEEQSVTLPVGGVVEVGTAYGSGKNRVQPIKWKAKPVVTAGVRSLVAFASS